MSSTDTKIMNQILDDISRDWGIRDDTIAILLHRMCPGRLVFLEDLTSGRIKPEAEDIVDLLNVRESLRRTYAIKTGTVLA